MERHGQVIKQMLTCIDTQKAIANLSEFDQVLPHCFQAKNAPIRRSGFSPKQIVDDHASAHALASTDNLEGEAFRRSLERRAQARQAFIEADNDAMRRSLLRRSTPAQGRLKPGMWMLYWIKRSNPNRAAAGRWHGPAKIISVEGSSIVYLSHGTKIIRAPAEYLRPASLHEWHQASPEALPEGRGASQAGGSSSVVDLQGMQPSSAEPSSSAYPDLIPSALPDLVPSWRTSHAVPAPSTGPVPLKSDETAQPEQECYRGSKMPRSR